jgi:uncharacterized protein YkwD
MGRVRLGLVLLAALGAACASSTPSASSFGDPPPAASAAPSPHGPGASILPGSDGKRPLAATVASSSSWIGYVNTYRAMARLDAVVEDATLSAKDALHARYIALDDDYEHAELADKPDYSTDGDHAAKNSVLAAANVSEMQNSFVDDVDQWMQAPLHALPILDPRLARVGFGSFTAQKSGIAHAAALDVNDGIDWVHPAIFPVMWPGDGAVVPLNHHWGEQPQTIAACPGYALPAGLPLYIELGDGTGPTPKIGAHSVRTGGAPGSSGAASGADVEHCVFDEDTVRLASDADTAVAKAILHARNAVVIIPRAPLAPGAAYAVTLEAGTPATRLAWSFTVAAAPRTVP